MGPAADVVTGIGPQKPTYYKTVFLVSPLYWALKPEREILMFMWSFGPLDSKVAGRLKAPKVAGRSGFLLVQDYACIAARFEEPQSKAALLAFGSQGVVVYDYYDCHYDFLFRINYCCIILLLPLF